MAEAKIRELESLLIDYVEKYGLTERARNYFLTQFAKEIDSADTKPFRSRNKECKLPKALRP